MAKLVIGIDPGKSGGIADTYNGFVAVAKMPATESDINFLISRYSEVDSCICYIERVHAMPGQGVTSMFNFGMNYGFLRGCLIANKIPFIEVRPQQWQKALGCTTKGLKGVAKKNVHKQKAQQLFPEQTITPAVADALLIMRYGELMEK